MNPLALEHGKLGFAADLLFYGGISTALAAFLVASTPLDEAFATLALFLLGLFGWTALEYALHRFVLHGMRPFSDWHAEHHLRPQALIFAPTIFSASLIVGLVFLPALWALEPGSACALTLGLMFGYLVYSIIHHALHQGQAGWLSRPRRWHALHHGVHIGPKAQHGPFGVTSTLWDHFCGSFPKPAEAANGPARPVRSGRYYRL